MALQISYTTPHGFTVQAAYVRVNNVEVSKTDGITALVRYFVSAADFSAEHPYVHEEIHHVPWDPVVHPWTAVYNHLRTLDAFATAVNV